MELADDAAVAAWQVAVLAPVGPLDRQRLLTAPGVDERLHLLEELLADAAEVLQLRLGSTDR